MATIKRFAFIAGFIIGLAAFVLIVGNVLLYLLTGKLPSAETTEDGRRVPGLISPEDVVAIVEKQIEGERAKYVSSRPGAGELS